jgi:hypothetical protein
MSNRAQDGGWDFVSVPWLAGMVALFAFDG